MKLQIAVFLYTLRHEGSTHGTWSRQSLPCTCFGDVKTRPVLVHLWLLTRSLGQDPAGTRAGGVEAHSCRMHAGQETALHRGQLTMDIGETGGTLAPALGEGVRVTSQKHCMALGPNFLNFSKEVARKAYHRH
jgi:hypothetical protein